MLNEEGLKRSIIVVATSSEYVHPPLPFGAAEPSKLPIWCSERTSPQRGAADRI